MQAIKSASGTLFISIILLCAAALPAGLGAQNPLLSFNDQLVEIVQRAEPSVVTVKTERTLKVNRRDPFSDMFGGGGGFDFFWGSPREVEYNQKGMGSGVIVSAEGYILTNNHVVNGADKVFIKTSTGAEFEAKVLGVDPRTDVAVLKVAPYSGMKPVTLGNSESLRVGELVLAIGSPLEEQLNQTVTMGIVSAKGRSNVGLADFEDFIQTDAAINPGNSGGALINMKGELVGINTAIVSQTGGNQGIGFAIPVNMAKNVMESLIQYGKVVRAYSGIFTTTASSEQSEAAGLSGRKSLVVTELDPEGPAVAAGLQPGDLILKLNGKDVSDQVQFRSRIATQNPGSKIEIEFFRAGKTDKTQVELMELPSPGGKAPSKYFMGFITASCSPELQKQYRIPEYDGLVITEVLENSNAAKAGLKPGDVLLMIDNTVVKSEEELGRAVRSRKEGDTIRIKIWRGGMYYFVNVELG